MGYSPWDHKKSDVTEHASKNAVIKIELCVGKIPEIDVIVTVRITAGRHHRPLLVLLTRTPNVHYFCFQFFLQFPPCLKTISSAALSRVASWSEPVEEEDLALLKFSLLVSFVN